VASQLLVKLNFVQDSLSVITQHSP